ncbi:MAG: metal ABC transporter permease [Candidatus Izemoplasmatales bacterium]|nr:metal ABC transporter permease [bacterium]MDZ4197244.1 metal ABC transporter permease [Candidatus Izemoplasmatales bacterium]
MMLSFFTDLFTQDFMQRALLAGLLLGVLAPLMGSIVVIRRLSFIADTLGHFSLVGVSVSLFLASIGWSAFFDKPLYLGIVFSVIGGLLIELFRRYYKNYKEISMPIVMSLGAALSAIFFSLSKRTGSLYNYIFGSILTITNYYIVLIGITLFMVLLLFLLFGKQVISVSFDESSAKFQGINLSLFQISFIVVLSIAVSVLLEAAGVLLVSSMMIIPVAAAMKVGWSYRSTLVISILFSELSVFLGLWGAYSLRIPSGASIVAINIIVLVIVAFIKRIVTRKRVKIVNPTLE